MKITNEHREEIRMKFADMQTIHDLLGLMNHAKPLIYGEKAKPFQLRQIFYYANPNLAQVRYKQFEISKKSGAKRIIHAPVEGLKSIQKVVSLILQCVFEPHKAATGFVFDKSIVDNARLHLNNRYVYNIDLKDFFPSVDQARVWKCFQLKPFNLIGTISPDNSLYNNILCLSDDNGVRSIYIMQGSWLSILKNSKGEQVIYTQTDVNKLVQEGNFLGTGDLSEEVITDLIRTDIMCKNNRRSNRSYLANILASICCTEMSVERLDENGDWVIQKRRVLPQGAPTSPVITNIVCQKLDFLLTKLAYKHGLVYSRYADDITFSSKHNVYQPDSEFLIELNEIITGQNFHIKESKTRLQKDGFRKEVTGLLVNDKVNVHKRYVKQLRMWIYYWEAYGKEKAEQIFKRDYFKDKGHVKNIETRMINVIQGKLNFMSMVKGPEDSTYKGLRERFDKLAGVTNPINAVLDIWETEGIEKAMELYYKEKS
jgi:retron-type reverse transcriptase